MPDGPLLFAAKVLAEVEVSSHRSNQHELNAGRLRTALRFPSEKVEGPLELVYVPGEEGDPEVERTTYSLYDSRKGKPRPPEYRLYYKSRDLQGRAAPGDVLIITRSPGSAALRALIIPRTSPAGSVLRGILQDLSIELDTRFRTVQAVIRRSDLEHLVSATADRSEVLDAGRILDALDPEMVRRSLETGSVPGTAAMASEAVRICDELSGGGLDPDRQLVQLLDIETAVFQHLERLIGQAAIDAAVRVGGARFDEMVELVMSRLQARRSRRGQSLQNHFGAILEREGVPFDAQGTTERGEKPDFLIPGEEEYHDPAFPADRLRMVACKSVVKERWRQILNEAERIPDKYLLTVDEGLTDATIAAMKASSLRTFIPAPLINVHYAGRSAVGDLGTVVELVNDLKSVTSS